MAISIHRTISATRTPFPNGYIVPPGSSQGAATNRAAASIKMQPLDYFALDMTLMALRSV
jgi:hypothetical protein